MVASINICGSPELIEDARPHDSLTHFSKTEVEREHSLERSQRDSQVGTTAFVVPCAGQGRSNSRPDREPQALQEQRSPCPWP
jgi:hypothetical protein